MRTRSASTAFLCVAAAASGASVLAQNRPAPRTMSVDEIRPGMHGYGLTVFHGTEPERFSVEVVDVLHHSRPLMDMILIRTSHPILDQAMTVAGMSGSPVYIDDRLIGAYAYGWEFPRDTVAGVTPIANMLPQLHIPRRTPPGLIPGSEVPLPIGPPAGGGGGRRPRRSSWNVLQDENALARASVDVAQGSLVPLAMPLSVSGMADHAFHDLAAALEPLGLEAMQSGGSAHATTTTAMPTHFRNGGSIDILMVQGDLSAAINGTVTYVDGDMLLGFGHPMLGLGETSLPTALARVVWINPSLRHSQKMSEALGPLGDLEQDRPFGIVCNDLGTPPLIPMHVHVAGESAAQRTDWNVSLAYQHSLVSRLYGSVVASVLETSIGESADVGWVVHSSVTTRSYGTLEFTDVGASGEGTGQLQTSGISSTEAVDRLVDNAFEQVRIDRIDVNVELHFARDFSYLRSIALSRAEADPGETVSVLVSLGGYAGPPVVRSIPITVPREVAGRDVEIEVSAGGDTVGELAEPESVSDLIHNLTIAFPDDALVVSMRMPGQGVTLRGRVVPNLPGSAFDVLRPAVSTESGEPFFNMRRTVVPIGRLVVGHDRVRLHVREIRQ